MIHLHLLAFRELNLVDRTLSFKVGCLNLRWCLHSDKSQVLGLQILMTGFDNVLTDNYDGNLVKPVYLAAGMLSHVVLHLVLIIYGCILVYTVGFVLPYFL